MAMGQVSGFSFSKGLDCDATANQGHWASRFSLPNVEILTMKKSRRLCLTLFAALFSLATTSSYGDVKLPAVLDSHMVLQRDAPIKVWGWADAGEQVTVTLGDESKATRAGKDGRWQVDLSPQKADGKTRQITVAGKNTIELTDVLIGEVWIGSGQSNMEWTLANTNGSAEAIAAADHPMIRLFHIPKVQNKEPASDVKANWKVCTPQNVPRFSAVLYYFGLQLQKRLNVPVGLINSSWGGSPIEPWTIVNGKSGEACTTE